MIERDPQRVFRSGDGRSTPPSPVPHFLPVPISLDRSGRSELVPQRTLWVRFSPSSSHPVPWILPIWIVRQPIRIEEQIFCRTEGGS